MLGEFGPGDDTYYLLGLDVIGQQTSAGWSYFGYDGLGSVRQMTDLTGALTYAASFDPYGSPFELYAAASTTLGFTGEQTDLNGLLYLRARYYNPALGSFLSLDPVQGVMGSALSFNPYLYVQGNPTNYVDPTGQFAWLALLIPFAKIVGAMIAGAAIGYASSRVVDAGAQLLFTGQIDWGQNAAAGIEGAILGAITGPFGLAAGALSARAVAQGVSRTLVRRAAFAFSLGLDVGVSAAWDTRVRGDGLGASLLSNIAGSVGGEIGGYLLGRARRAVQGSLNSLGSTARNTWQTSGQVAGTVFRAPAGFLLGTGIGGPLPFNPSDYFSPFLTHGNRKGSPAPGIVYRIMRTDADGIMEVFKYGKGSQSDVYREGGRPRLRQDGSIWYARPQRQVNKLNAKNDGYTYDWNLLAITENRDDAIELERLFVSLHVQIAHMYPFGQNERPRVLPEYIPYPEWDG